MLACGPGDDGESRLRTPPADASAIRAVDFEREPAVQTLVQQIGSGAIDVRAILYADVTGDLREEAIVPVTSQGTMGNVAYLVFKLDAGKPRVVLTRTADRSTAGGLKMSAAGGVLLETRAVYGEEDPLCCPSRLRETSFRWDGSSLQVDSESIVQQAPSPKF